MFSSPLVGGSIIVTEIRREGRKRYHLQGRFTLRSGSIANAASDTTTDDEGDGECLQDEHVEEIVIDFVDPDPLIVVSARRSFRVAQQRVALGI